MLRHLSGSRSSGAAASSGGGVRRPVHAGSWYSDDPEELRDDIQRLLAAEYAEGATPDPLLKAVITPHAGLRYSGSVAARVYAALDVGAVRRIFLIGPSHHAPFRGCALPGERVTAYRTPLGDLPLDRETLAQLRRRGDFATLQMAVDEEEHSLEMQLPFLAELLLNSPMRDADRDGMATAALVPILVGSVSARDEGRYGQLLAPYLEAEGTIFVISSDFCHWGAQFGYTRRGSRALAETYKDGPHVDNASIEGLDREGMNLVAGQDAKGFRSYLERDGNTICGKHPILVLLETMGAASGAMQIDFVKYMQSSAMKGMPPASSSSVSYACAICAPQQLVKSKT